MAVADIGKKLLVANNLLNAPFQVGWIATITMQSSPMKPAITFTAIQRGNYAGTVTSNTEWLCGILSRHVFPIRFVGFMKINWSINCSSLSEPN